MEAQITVTPIAPLYFNVHILDAAHDETFPVYVDGATLRERNQYGPAVSSIARFSDFLLPAFIRDIYAARLLAWDTMG